jgi:hypothetical protein
MARAAIVLMDKIANGEFDGDSDGDSVGFPDLALLKPDDKEYAAGASRRTAFVQTSLDSESFARSNVVDCPNVYSIAALGALGRYVKPREPEGTTDVSERTEGPDRGR